MWFELVWADQTLLNYLSWLKPLKLVVWATNSLKFFGLSILKHVQIKSYLTPKKILSYAVFVKHCNTLLLLFSFYFILFLHKIQMPSEIHCGIKKCFYNHCFQMSMRPEPFIFLLNVGYIHVNIRYK